MTNKIQALAEILFTSRQNEKQIRRKALKQLIDGMTDAEFLTQMVKVDNPNIFSQLWSIGLNGRKQEIAIQRMKELEQ